MEHILPAYNDPLFSILMIIFIGLIIAVATYAWGMYKQQKEAGSLLKFLDKFDSAECALDTTNMPFEEHMFKPLTLLAKAFENSGEYHKAINIYIYLIRNLTEDPLKTELMERLGSTYLHAGFLERAKSIYVEILRKKPRSKKVLYELGAVYEMMQETDKAEEILEPLLAIGEDIRPLETFLSFSKLISDRLLPADKKCDSLIRLLHEEPSLYRLVVAELLRLDTRAAWETIDPARIHEILDILWFLPNSQLDLDIISHHTQLSTIYYAKGYLQRPLAKSGIFTIDMIAKARENGFEDADLQFSYLCKKCKQSFPVSFKRCPGCMAINSVEVEEQIVKARTQTDHSLL